ncbi:MAG: acyl-CoA thioesterase [Bacteroidota bacterium]|nr:acyl-CoA thioesterase [Bacteroidota bacterium]MDX5430647.1 acyl-CoA thioesterase [Bacteroidota bacterium]MDX5469397.1 acyl-CoA thioesterase [Bacteroidota bacterium]
MFISETTSRVRYGETDQMGYMYHGNYAQYYETGRVEALRQLGTSYKALEDEGVMMPVLEIKSKFIKPAKYDDLITIRTMLRNLPTARVQFEFELYNESRELIHTAEVQLVFVRSSDMRPIRCPEWLYQLFETNFEK